MRHLVDTAEAREALDLTEQVVGEHTQREREHQEVDAERPARDEAETEADEGCEHHAGEGTRPRAPVVAEVEPEEPHVLSTSFEATRFAIAKPASP